MNRSNIAFVLFALVVSSGSAQAALSGNGLLAVQNYLSDNPGIPQYIKDELLNANDLTQAQNLAKSNSYWTVGGMVYLKPIPDYTPATGTQPGTMAPTETIPATLLKPATKPVVEPAIIPTPDIATDEVTDTIKLPPVDLSKYVTPQTSTPHTPEIETEDVGDNIKLPPVDLSKYVTTQTSTPHTPEIEPQDVSDIITLPPVDLSKMRMLQATVTLPMTNIEPSQTTAHPDTGLMTTAPAVVNYGAVDQAAIAANKTNILDNKHEIVAVETQLDSNKRSLKDDEMMLQQHGARLTSLAKGVDQAEATGEQARHRADVAFTAAQKAETTGENAQFRADTAFAHAEANKQALAATNHRIAADDAELANHEQRLGSLESQTSSNFSKLKSQIDDNRKRSSAGIAGVAAMANIPQVTNTQDFSVGAGAGTADSESALAVGFSARATENVVMKASVSDDSQHNFVAGAGVSYGW